MNIGIIGAGFIGRKRAEVVAHSGDKLIAVADINYEKAKYLAQNYRCDATDDWHEIVARGKDIETIIVATTNDMLSEISISSLKAKKNVLCEKPMGRNFDESLQMYQASQENGVCLKIGFNHRFHPALRKAHDLFNKAAIGDIMYIRAVYGHGAREDYDKEWRMDPEISGGGELIDQGVHLLDLFRWFMGEFSRVFAINTNTFWNRSLSEDNSFFSMQTKDGKVAFAQVSATQWKNKFLFEIFGKKGYLIIDGLGKSYGPEKLIYGKRETLGQRPIEKVFEFPEEDVSWILEWEEFKTALTENREPLGSGHDGLKANELLFALYKSHSQKSIIELGDANGR